LDISLDLPTQIALDRVILIDDLSNRPNLSLGQILDVRRTVDSRTLDDLFSSGIPDTVDVGQCDLDAFFPRKIDACYPCHDLTPRA